MREVYKKGIGDGKERERESYVNGHGKGAWNKNGKKVYRRGQLIYQ